MKKFVSFHPVYACHEDFFSRDFGQIGVAFQKKKGFVPETWSLLKPGRSSFEKEGQYWRGFRSKFSMFFSLFLRSRSIDVLHMYHIYLKSFLGSILYRICNWRGIIYIKMDTPIVSGDINYIEQFQKKPRFFLNMFFRLVSFVGFEDDRLLSFFNDTYPKYANKFLLTTSGGMVLGDFIGRLSKENIISLCGRFGSVQKNNEMLLNILEYKDCSFLKDWKIYFVGTLTNEFSQKLQDLFQQQPDLKEKIIVTGFLTEKKEVYDILSKSKIFLHTASWEGDPNIQYDAMFCGCYLVSTDVANMKQNYPIEYASFYDIKDTEGLYSGLKKAIPHLNSLRSDDYAKIQEYFLENFTRESALSQILEKV